MSDRRLARNDFRSSDFVIEFYPRFLSGRGLLAALVLGDGSDVLKFCESGALCSERATSKSFESLIALRAALALLLGLFFGVDIVISDQFLLRSIHPPPTTSSLL